MGASLEVRYLLSSKRAGPRRGSLIWRNEPSSQFGPMGLAHPFTPRFLPSGCPTLVSPLFGETGWGFWPQLSSLPILEKQGRDVHPSQRGVGFPSYPPLTPWGHKRFQGELGGGELGDKGTRGRTGTRRQTRRSPIIPPLREGAPIYSFLTSSTNKLIITIYTIAHGGSQSGEPETWILGPGGRVARRK